MLTQDCYLAPIACAEMYRFMQDHPRCAIAGIKQLLDENPDQIIHGGCTRAYPAGQHIGGLVSRGDCIANRRMPWVNGSCMIVRMEAVKEIGLLDENMRLVGIESDWCYTARARGWEVWYCAQAQCLHEGGVSSGKEPNPSVIDIMRADMDYWRRKWVGSAPLRRSGRRV